MNYHTNRGQRAYAILVEDILEDFNYAKQVAADIGLDISHYIKSDLERIEQGRVAARNNQQAAYPMDINSLPKNNCVAVVLAESSILFKLSICSCSRVDEQGDEADINVSKQGHILHEGAEVN